MSQPGLPTLNDLPLSGTKTIILTSEDHIVSQRIPGKEGAIIERVGAKMYSLEIHGFFESGGEQFKDRLLTIATSGADIQVPNTTGGYWLKNFGGFYIENVEVQYVPGWSYPFYNWRVKGLLSGYEVGVLAANGVSFAQTLPLMGTGFTSFVRMSGF